MNQPLPSRAPDVPPATDEGSSAIVLRFPSKVASADKLGRRRWRFSYQVHGVRGIDSAWLSEELAVIVRQLVKWSGDDLDRHEEDRAA